MTFEVVFAHRTPGAKTHRGNQQFYLGNLVVGVFLIDEPSESIICCFFLVSASYSRVVSPASETLYFQFPEIWCSQYEVEVHQGSLIHLPTIG